MEKILDKIKKCLALSASSEPHEAAAAMRQAQALMAKYNVDETILNRHEVGETKIQSKFSVSQPKVYELKLIQTVCRAFGCTEMWSKSHSNRDNPYGRWIIIGMKSQVQVAEYTISVLLRQMVKGRTKFVSSISTGHSRKYISTEANGWCMGWIDAISKTVHDFANPDGVQNEINRLVESRTGGRVKNVSGKNQGFMGAMAGQEDGKKVSLHRPMNETKHKMLK